MELRDYQIAILDKARARMQAGVRSLLLEAPCGSGKTVLTAHMLRTAASKDIDSWFVVHRRELIEQSSATFTAAGVSHGIAASGTTMNVWPKVQICAVQSIRTRQGYLRKPKLIVYDEAHHIAAATWKRIFDENPQAFHLGLSATPVRLDGKGLGDFFSEIIHGPTVEWLIQQGYLSSFKVYAPPGADMTNVPIRMGDYAKKEAAAAVDRPTITGSAIEHYKKLADGKRAIVYATNIEHSQRVVSEFNAAGVPALHIDGETSAVDRANGVDAFRAGRFKVLSNVDLFGEGFDLPALEVAILLRPTASLGLYIQQAGRALRPSVSKSTATIIDHVGNVARHGFPDEPREWSLNSTRNARKVRDVSSPGVTICPACFAAQYSGADRCSYCGHALPIKKREVEEVDGELVELQRKAAVRERKIQQGGARTLEELIELGRQRGYKNPYGWAAHLHKARMSRGKK